MSFYIVKFNGKNYASEELFNTAIAGGERSFIKMLGRKEVSGQVLFDQVLYPLTPEQEVLCRKLNISEQDLDSFIEGLSNIPESTLEQVRHNECSWLKGATVITVGININPELFKFKRVVFIKAELYKRPSSQALTKMAAIKICGRWYIALNAVDIRIERPIIVTI